MLGRGGLFESLQGPGTSEGYGEDRGRCWGEWRLMSSKYMLPLNPTRVFVD